MKKGFTLIELLAVIVILAIIAVIAVPIVLNIIEETKENAMIRSAENYMKHMDLLIAKNILNGGDSLADGTYNVSANGDLCLNEDCTEILKVEMSGTKPNGGSITIKNNVVTKEGLSLEIGDYTISYSNNELVANKFKFFKGILCTYDLLQSYRVTYDENYDEVIYDENYDYTYTTWWYSNKRKDDKEYIVGERYTCDLGDGDRNFYIIETKGDTVSLIMNDNLGDPVAWVSKEDYIEAGGTASEYGIYGNNSKGPITALKALRERTSSWKKLHSSQITLPTKAQARSVSSYNIDVSYWTSTPDEKRTTNAWAFGRYDYSDILGSVTDGHLVTWDTKNGIRPVITISKMNLN